MTATANLFLSGPHAPWRQEGQAVSLQVEGRIPEELTGTLYRTISSPQFEPVRPERYHWFDGDGMIAALTLRDGAASLHNRYVETTGLRAERAAGRALYCGINGGEPLTMRPDAPPFKNPANTNVTVFGGRLLVFTEVDVPHELHRDDLSTLGRFDFGAITGSVTAHWKVDPDNGDLLFFGYQGPMITWYRADRTGRLLESHSFDVGVSSSQHDFTVTRDYAIFFISPACIDPLEMMQGRPGLTWEPEVGVRIAVMSRADFSVRMFEAPGVWAPTHFLNAYQEGDEVVVDGNRCPQWGHPKGEVGRGLWFTPAAPWRWRLNMRTGALKSDQMSDVNSEFPRHNERLVGKKARYGYYAATRGPDFCENWLFDHVAKHDFARGVTEYQNIGGALSSPGESVFVPREGAIDEDDGWIMTMWWDPQSDTSEFVILNGQDFSGEPAARIKLSHRLPMGFHGNWVAAGA